MADGDDEQAIRAVVQQWMEASARGDTAAVLDLMADDVLFMTPQGAPFGKEEFRARSSSLQGVKIDGRSDIQELQVAGDWAWLRNHLEIQMSPPDVQPVRRSGAALTIFKKEKDGRWRLFRDANLVQ